MVRGEHEEIGAVVVAGETGFVLLAGQGHALGEAESCHAMFDLRGVVRVPVGAAHQVQMPVEIGKLGKGVEQGEMALPPGERTDGE